MTSFETSFGGIIPIGLEVEAYKAVKERNMKNLKYHLIHKKDTILQVNYIGSIAPTFQIDNFGYDAQSMLMYNDTVFKGFIIMSSQVKTYKGHQVHLVERINKDQHLEKPFTYTLDFDVIINSIKCDNIGDDTLINSSSRERSIELTGKIGIISQGIKQNIGANIPTISNNLIAEYKEPIILKKMESRRNLSNKKSLRIHENEEFFLRVAFNENVDFHKVIPMGGTNFIVKKEPSEQIEADGSTVKGATMFFYKIGEPNRFIIKAEGTHKTKITIEGSIIVKKKTKRLPVVKQGNAGL